jgi:hypothetical protein
MLIDLGPKQVLVIVNIHVSSRRGTPCPMTWKLAHIKMTRQIDNAHLGISFYLPFGIAFYFEMHRRMSTMGML